MLRSIHKTIQANFSPGEDRQTVNLFSIFLRAILIAITIILTWLAFVKLKLFLTETGAMDPGAVWSTRFPLMQGFAVVAITVLCIGTFNKKTLSYWDKFIQYLSSIPFARVAWVSANIVMQFALIYLVYRRSEFLSTMIETRLLVAWILFWLSYSGLSVWIKFRDLMWWQKITICASWVAAVFTICNALTRLTESVLRSGWSEGSTLFYATSFLSSKIYGTEIGLPVINPGKALMQSFPFLFPKTTIYFHRLWDVILWYALPLLVGFALSKRLKINNPILSLGLAFFTLLFLNGGPVYYHLLVAALIILIGFRSDRFWLSLFVVVLASFWAGLTRINWFVMPGALAAIIYLLETPRPEKLLDYIRKPMVWFVVGFGISFLSFLGYIKISGTPADYFENPLSTPLLWYRLFPSATNETGIINSILIATAPAMLLIGIYFLFSRSYHWISKIGIGGLLLAFLLGGALVSVRIGGGNNLHNFDGFFLILWVVICYLLFSQKLTEQRGDFPAQRHWIGFFACLLLLQPFINSIRINPSTPQVIDPVALQNFHNQVETDILAKKNILLMENPQLIAFHFWESPPNPPPFEKVFLMEAAMTGNSAYLDQYYAALSSKRFDTIISEPLSVFIQGRDHPFGEENDAWVKFVAEPTLCYYEVVASFPELGMDYLAPRKNICETDY